jgi:hypothetical protein
VLHGWHEEEAGVEEVACSGARDKAAACSRIEDGRWRRRHGSF